MIQIKLRKPRHPIQHPNGHRVKRPILDYDLLNPPFHLCKKGKCLMDHLTVSDYDIQHGDTLDLVPK